MKMIRVFTFLLILYNISEMRQCEIRIKCGLS